MTKTILCSLAFALTLSAQTATVKEGVKTTGDVAKATGEKVKTGAEVTGEKVKTGTEATVSGTKKVVKTTTKVVKKGTNKVASATETGAKVVKEKTDSK